MATCTDFIATCRLGACRKRCYASRAAAKLAGRQQRGRGHAPKLRVYRHGAYWHHTSQSAAVTAYFKDHDRL